MARLHLLISESVRRNADRLSLRSIHKKKKWSQWHRSLCPYLQSPQPSSHSEKSALVVLIKHCTCIVLFSILHIRFLLLWHIIVTCCFLLLQTFFRLLSFLSTYNCSQTTKSIPTRFLTRTKNIKNKQTSTRQAFFIEISHTRQKEQSRDGVWLWKEPHEGEEAVASVCPRSL